MKKETLYLFFKAEFGQQFFLGIQRICGGGSQKKQFVWQSFWLSQPAS